MTEITEFRGRYAWLSNFAPCEVTLVAFGAAGRPEDETYPSVEHAYQAAKFKEAAIRDKVRQAPTPGAAKRQARLWPITTSDWESQKVKVMRYLLAEKFTRPDLAEKLLATGDAYLEEGNTWGDTFWGVCQGAGANQLGRLLMEQRERLGGPGVVAQGGEIDLDLDLHLGEDDYADLGIDFDTPQEGPWYLHHPESDCVWEERDRAAYREALSDGLVEEVDADEYRALKVRYGEDDDDLDLNFGGDA